MYVTEHNPTSFKIAAAVYAFRSLGSWSHAGASETPELKELIRFDLLLERLLHIVA